MYKTAEQISWNILLKAAASEGGNPELWRKMVNRIAKSKGMPAPTDAEFAEMFPPDFATSSKTMEDAIQGSKWFNKANAGPSASSPSSNPYADYNPRSSSSSRQYSSPFDDFFSRYNQQARQNSHWDETASGRKARWAKENAEWDTEWDKTWDAESQARAEARKAEQQARDAQWEERRQRQTRESADREKAYQEKQKGYSRRTAASTESNKYYDQARGMKNRAAAYTAGLPTALGMSGLAIGAATEDKDKRNVIMGGTGAGAGASMGYGSVLEENARRFRNAIKPIPFSVDEGFQVMKPYNKMKATPHTVMGGLLGLGLGLGGSHLIQKAFYDQKKTPMRKAASAIAASILANY
jgi:hypothetical protein